MDLSKLREVCQRYSGKDFYVEPLPARKAAGARSSLNIRSSEQMVALIDFTIFGGAEDAMVITDGGITWKNMNDDAPMRLTWAQLRQRTIRENKTLLSKKIDLGNGLEIELDNVPALILKDDHRVVDLLSELNALPEQVTADPLVLVPASGSIVGLVECEFCKGKVKPYVTYCKHCGIKLRG